MKLTIRGAAPAAGLGLMVLLAGWAIPLVEAKTRIDPDKIYYGDAKKYKRAAVVDAMKVYRKIPAHQEIADRKLTREDPDYWPLLRKASQAFVRALRKVCVEKGYDLVGEVSTIAVDGEEIPEITAAVIAELEKPAPEKAEKAEKPEKATKAGKTPAKSGKAVSSTPSRRQGASPAAPAAPAPRTEGTATASWRP